MGGILEYFDKMIIQGKIPGARDPVNILIEGGTVARVEPYRQEIHFDFGGPDLYLSRGFFDPQVMGLVAWISMATILLWMAFIKQFFLSQPLVYHVSSQLSSQHPMKRLFAN